MGKKKRIRDAIDEPMVKDVTISESLGPEQLEKLFTPFWIDEDSPNELHVVLNPHTTSPQQALDLLSAIANLYRVLGGAGLTITHGGELPVAVSSPESVHV